MRPDCLLCSIILTVNILWIAWIDFVDNDQQTVQNDLKYLTIVFSNSAEYQLTQLSLPRIRVINRIPLQVLTSNDLKRPFKDHL